MLEVPQSNTNLSLRNWPQWVRHCSDWLSSWSYWIFARTVWSDANRPVHHAITRSFFLVLGFSIVASSCEAMILHAYHPYYHHPSSSPSLLVLARNSFGAASL